MVWTNLFCRPGQFWHLVLHWVRWLENSPIVLHACNNICIRVWSLVVLGALGLSLICSPKQKRCPTSTFKVSNFIERKTFFSLSQPRCADELPSCHQTVGRRLPWMSEWRSRQQKALAPRHPPTLLQQKVHQPIDTEWVLLSSLLFFLQQKSLCLSTHLYSLWRG